ncbi:hypothetical protein NB525_03715 [Vibrio alginolyticus]|uniref:hypothetical protein n=1 Tax=Vibrio TaxID=662 RepID=UPI00215BF445|nr:MULTISPECIES: hypothetical protein [Vibrio]MCR9593118.1 hypothetical protein [Vibrio alginolyticus]MDW1762627.1 hypothetical protein [Vibrio sp. Vb2135]
MKKLKVNVVNQIFFLSAALLTLLLHHIIQSVNSYVFSSLLCFLILVAFKGFKDLKTPLSIFNYFYFFFVVFGFLCESFIRGFNYDVSSMVLISAFSFNLLLPFRSYEHKTSIRYNVNNSRLLVQLSSVFCVFSIVCSLLYFKSIGSIPLFTAVTPEDRINAMTGRGHFLQPMRFGPISALILYIVLPRKSKYIGVVAFVICNVFILGTGFRGTFFQNLLLFIMTSSLVNGFTVNFYKSIKIGIVLITSVIGIGILRGDGAVISSFAIKIAHSVSVSIYILNMVVEHFNDFKYGMTFFYKFSSVLPVDNIEFTQWLTTQLPMNFSGGVTPTIVGDMYINFGRFYWLGMLAIGGSALYLEKVLLRNKTDDLVLFLVLNIALGLARTATGGLSNTLFQTTLSCIFIMSFILLTKLNRSNLSRGKICP